MEDVGSLIRVNSNAEGFIMTTKQVLICGYSAVSNTWFQNDLRTGVCVYCLVITQSVRMN